MLMRVVGLHLVVTDGRCNDEELSIFYIVNLILGHFRNQLLGNLEESSVWLDMINLNKFHSHTLNTYHVHSIKCPLALISSHSIPHHLLFHKHFFFSFPFSTYKITILKMLLSFNTMLMFFC